MTAILIFLPIVAALILSLLKGINSGIVALITSVLQFILTITVWMVMETGYPGDFFINEPWIPSLGINFSVGIDGISLILVFLTNFLVPLIILSAFSHKYDRPHIFYALVLLMQGALVGVFVARDAFLFYIFWELALIPIYFICLLWGGKNRQKITFKFFLYTLVGSLFMLVGIIFLYLQTGPDNSYSITAFYALDLPVSVQMWVFWAMFLAFAIKMPIFPFHTWQPDTYTVAPTAGTMLLSGIMLKMGIYGVIRWLLPVTPDAVNASWGGNLAVILAVIGIVYASVIALKQKDYKRLIAYVSIAHVGLIAAGVLTTTSEGIQGAVIQMLSHGIVVFGLFFVLDIIYSRTNTFQLEKLGGIRNYAPQFSWYFLVILLAGVALPLTSGFVGEFLLITGVFLYDGWLAAIAGLTIIFGAGYMLSSYQRTILGKTNENITAFADLNNREKLILIPILVMIFWIGFYPQTFLEMSEPAVTNIIREVRSSYSLK